MARQQPREQELAQRIDVTFGNDGKRVSTMWYNRLLARREHVAVTFSCPYISRTHSRRGSAHTNRFRHDDHHLDRHHEPGVFEEQAHQSREAMDDLKQAFGALDGDSWESATWREDFARVAGKLQPSEAHDALVEAAQIWDRLGLTAKAKLAEKKADLVAQQVAAAEAAEGDEDFEDEAEEEAAEEYDE